jgi:hypothetical protein
MSVAGVAILILLVLLCYTVVEGVIRIANQKYPQPIAITTPATEVTASTARLNGAVNPKNGGEKYFFEYGPNRSYGYSTKSYTGPEGTVGRTPVSAWVSALKPNTTYGYRIAYFYDEYAGGRHYVYGPAQSFHTAR